MGVEIDLVVHESGVGGDGVVKSSRSGVVLLGQPVDLRESGVACRVADVVDQGAPDAGPAAVGGDEQILEVAVAGAAPGRRMGEPVDQTDGATLVVTCDRTVDTVTGDDAPERDCGDLGIQVGLCLLYTSPSPRD